LIILDVNGGAMRGLKAMLPMMLALGAAACSASDPVPSAIYDGQYAGTRRSDQTEACGVTRLQGTTYARITGGRLSMRLFTAKTQMTGTVGEDGRVRASGIWPNPTGGFPGMTVLNGQVADATLSGTATDFRCHTDIRLQRVAPSRGVKLRP
jgi:hypothetical protein